MQTHTLAQRADLRYDFRSMIQHRPQMQPDCTPYFCLVRMAAHMPRLQCPTDIKKQQHSFPNNFPQAAGLEPATLSG